MRRIWKSLAKRKDKPAAKPSKAQAVANGAAAAHDEDADIAATRKALEPLVKKGVGPHRLASACGAHVDDLRGFLEGRVSLTPALRARLRAAVPSILESLSSPRESPPE